MKKMSKRIIPIVLACLLTLALLPVSALAAGWQSHWSAEYIQTAVDKGWVKEDANGNIPVGEAVSRADFAVILWRAIGSPAAKDACPFTDVTEEEAQTAIAALSEQGIVEGKTETSFAPTDTLTRQEGLVLLARAFGLTAVDPDAAAAFTDWPDVADWAQDAIAALVEKGIVDGVGGNRLAPVQDIALGEMCKALVVTREAMSTATPLKAGVGGSEIIFPQEMFPVEGFNGVIHDAPCARVLLMDAGGKQVAIVSIELVGLAADVVGTCKSIVSEKTGTPIENIWIHATHAITTPHAPDDSAKRELYVNAVTTAVTAASEQAAGSFQEAVMGVGVGTCDVNANRDIELNGQQYYGLGSTKPSNKEMTIVRFDTLEGEPIGFFISYGIKPTAIDNSEMSAGTRVISADVPAIACRLMEEEFGVPAMFCMPAAGDQIPKETALFYTLDENGEPYVEDIGVEAGIEIVERLGGEMGDTAIDIANDITGTEGARTIYAKDTSFTWDSKSGDSEVEIAVRGIAIGDELAFVGFKPEVNAITEQQLWERSPIEHTLLVSFVDGDQKYMPDAGSYDEGTWEYMRAGMAKGAAEEFVSVAADLLSNIEIPAAAGEGPDQDGQGGDTTKETIQMGGYDWIVLDKQEDRMLVLSEKVLEQQAYHAPGGAITWEDCELRAYLNGEFYEKTFSSEEQAKIIETTIENRSNGQYGIAGGNDTTDKVFLLSLSEAEKYLGDGIELLRGIDITTGEVTWWHLRSPGEATDVNASVNSIGLIDYHGVVDGVTDSSGGVRPAMWVTIDD